MPLISCCRPLLAACLLSVLILLPANPAWTPGSGAPHGHLLIVGGGDTPPEVLQRFIDLAGGVGVARIAVLPMATLGDDSEAVEVVADLRALGAEAEVLTLSRAEAARASVEDLLEQYSGFWFTGGDQARLAAILRDTPALAALQRRYSDGAVIAGTSAGAAVMSHVMLSGTRELDPEAAEDALPLIARGLVDLDEGFGLLPGTIIDQHFLRRARHNRLLSAVLERPELVGIGIDEGTAVLVRPDRQWEILGASYVKVFDARRAAVAAAERDLIGSAGITLHVLPSRSVFDPQTGRTALPAGSAPQPPATPAQPSAPSVRGRMNTGIMRQA